MRFPYKRSVGQDLRDLFQVERLSSQARTLAHSSMRQGEGAVRFLNADGTAALAILGDLPGGGYGVGIPNGAGGFVSIQDHVAGKFAALRASDIPTNSGSTVQGDLTWAANRAESAYTTAQTAINRLNSLAASQVASGSAGGTVQADLTYLGQQTASATSRLNSLAASQVASGSAGGTVQADLTYLGQQTASATSRLNSLTAAQVASGSAGGTVQADLTYLGQQAASASTRLGSAESTLGSHGATLGALGGRTDSLEFRMYQAEQRNGEQQDEINELRRRINSAGIPP